jgi:hypothetical protein
VRHWRGGAVRHRHGGACGGHGEGRAVEGARWRSACQRVCGGEMKGLGFRCSCTLKNKNSSDRYDDVINVGRYI